MTSSHKIAIINEASLGELNPKEIKNQIVLYSEGVWYKYDPLLGKILVLEEFQPYNNKNLAHYDDGFFWFIDDENEGPKEVIYTDLKEQYFILDDTQLH